MLKLTKFFTFTALLFCVSQAQAWVFEQIPDKTVAVKYRHSLAANTSTNTILIDLSDTTNFPHKETGQINISSIRVEFDKAAASTGTIKLGVVTYVNSSTGAVTWFYGKESLFNVSNAEPTDILNQSPNFYKLKVRPNGEGTNGSTPYVLSNDTSGFVTTFQTDVVLTTPTGTMAAPGLGDIVFQGSSGAATVVINIEVLYHSEN